MTHKVQIFANIFQDSSTGHRTTFRGQIWWKSAVVKLPKRCLDYHTDKKTRAPRDSSHPVFSQNGSIAPKIPWTLSPLDMYTEFGPDQLRFAGLILERLIFRPQN